MASQTKSPAADLAARVRSLREERANLQQRFETVTAESAARANDITRYRNEAKDREEKLQKCQEDGVKCSERSAQCSGELVRFNDAPVIKRANITHWWDAREAYTLCSDRAGAVGLGPAQPAPMTAVNSWRSRTSTTPPAVLVASRENAARFAVINGRPGVRPARRAPRAARRVAPASAVPRRRWSSPAPTPCA